MERQQLKYLLEKYTNGEATPVEIQELKQIDLSIEANRKLLSELMVEGFESHHEPGYDSAFFDNLDQHAVAIDQKMNHLQTADPSVRRVYVLRRWWIAASIIFIVGAVSVIVMSSDRQFGPSAKNITVMEDIIPGRDGAVLTLADGTEVVLDSLGNGMVALQNGSTAIIKNGGLVYDVTGDIEGEVLYNTMATPKGRQYSLLLSDGTRVWLNAASSIRYPTLFTGKSRQVELSGEAYFEVAKNKQMPFLVNINGKAEVEVLGTHFNVNAYENEAAISTTLLEGKVRISHLNQEKSQRDLPVAHPDEIAAVVLSPGQQAQLAVTLPADQQPPFSQQIKLIQNADLDKVMAWKNGTFNFEDASLEEIMRQFERWYDIEVVYGKKVPDIALMGKLTRGVTLNELLPALKKMGLNYRLEGRRLLVLP